jgi:hypothetical protein
MQDQLGIKQEHGKKYFLLYIKIFIKIKQGKKNILIKIKLKNFSIKILIMKIKISEKFLR